MLNFSDFEQIESALRPIFAATLENGESVRIQDVTKEYLDNGEAMLLECSFEQAPLAWYDKSVDITLIFFEEMLHVRLQTGIGGMSADEKQAEAAVKAYRGTAYEQRWHMRGSQIPTDEGLEKMTSGDYDEKHVEDLFDENFSLFLELERDIPCTSNEEAFAALTDLLALLRDKDFITAARPAFDCYRKG